MVTGVTGSIEPDPVSRRPENRRAFAGRLSRELGKASLFGEICEIVAGDKPGRERAQEAILFWHRGLSLTDIALGAAMLEKAKRLDLGQRLRYA